MSTFWIDEAVEITQEQIDSIKPGLMTIICGQPRQGKSIFWEFSNQAILAALCGPMGRVL